MNGFRRMGHLEDWVPEFGEVNEREFAMRVFVTGASGFIGTHTVPELVKAGHTVLGMVRSDAGAETVAALGAGVHRGDIYDLESVRQGAEGADAVIHLAFNHDFVKPTAFADNAFHDAKVIAALGEVLQGSDRPMLITSGTGVASHAAPGKVGTEDDPHPGSQVMPRAASEEAADALVEKGVRVGVVRLPQVHSTANKAGLVNWAVAMAKQQGEAIYVGDGQQLWAAAHVGDVARLYRLALEQCEAGLRYNAVGEEGVAMKPVVELFARGVGIPARSVTLEEAKEKMGFLGMFLGNSMPASSAKTQAKLGWTPTGPTLLEDMAAWDWTQF